MERDALSLERAASRDLLDVDKLVRALYAALSGSAPAAAREALCAGPGERARLRGCGCPWWPPDGRGEVGLRRLLDALGAAGSPLRFGERSRTVHVLSDLAVVVSTFEVERRAPPAAWRGAFLLELWRGEGGWRLEAIASQEVAAAVTEKTADPRPLAARRGDG